MSPFLQDKLSCTKSSKQKSYHVLKENVDVTTTKGLDSKMWTKKYTCVVEIKLGHDLLLIPPFAISYGLYVHPKKRRATLKFL